MNAVHRAGESNRVDLYLQPIVTLPQRKVRYYEAVMRLRTDDGKEWQPSDILDPPIAAALTPRIDNLLVLRCVQVVRRLQVQNREIGLFCGISLDTLGSLTQSFNTLIAAGALEGESGRFAVKVPSLFEKPQDILRVPIVASPKATVTLLDIAQVLPTFKDATSVTRVNGRPAMTIEVSKRTGANLIETVDAVKHVVAQLQRVSPGAAEHRLLHHDAVPDDGDGPALGDEDGTEQHAALGADGDVTAERGGGSDVRGLVDARALALVLDEHGTSLLPVVVRDHSP